MTTRKLWLLSIGLAGLLQCGMGTYHFVLPYQMDWAHAHGLENLPDSMVWALYILNFSWSLLVVVTGGLVLTAAATGPTTAPFTRRALFAVGLFWAIHGSYQLLHPMPLPARLVWLQFALAGFPAIVAALLWLPLIAARTVQVRAAQP